MPFNVSTTVLFYNKDAFRKAGLDAEKPPQTWPQLIEAAKKIRSTNAAACGYTTTWMAWVMLEQFANSSYTDFGAYQKALVGGDGIDDAVTQGLKNNLAKRLQDVGLGNVSGATGANLATTGDNQIVSLLRLSLFAYPTAETFMAQAAKGLPEAGESAQAATGALRDHLET
jgi:ABC-type glycerol-3-phosphate transport system substrate-binding protein